MLVSLSFVKLVERGGNVEANLSEIRVVGFNATTVRESLWIMMGDMVTTAKKKRLLGYDLTAHSTGICSKRWGQG